MNKPTLRNLITPAALALTTGPALAQFHADCGCGSHLRPEEVELARAQEDAGMYQLAAGQQDGVLYRIVRVKIHIVRQSTSFGGISTSSVWASLARANSELTSAKIFLIPQGEVDYIDDDSFYYNIDTQAEINALRMVRPQPDMLNIYFTLNLSIEEGSLCGQSSYTYSPSQGIVMKNSCTTGDSVLSHEVGHYWDLYHTHETMFGPECVSGENCATGGDRICDTPADPNLTSMVSQQCQYIGAAMDPCGSFAPYTPDTLNTMSYTRKSCMNHLSAQQCAKAQATLVNLRPAHQLGIVDLNYVVHYDSSGPANGNGLWLTPINDFEEALAATLAGGVLAIGRADANEGPITLTRKMTIYNSGPESTSPGQATIVRLGAP